MKSLALLACSALLVAIPVTGSCAENGNLAPSDQHSAHETDTADSLIAIPSAIREEHKEIHAVLQSASREEGALGEAARNLERVMAPHFQREEEIAMPPLGLLVPLAQGPVTEEMEAVLPLTRQLEEEMTEMLAQHEQIVGALERFRAVAQETERFEYVAFADRLELHARHEEQILYPSALLVGKTVRNALPQNNP